MGGAACEGVDQETVKECCGMRASTHFWQFQANNRWSVLELCAAFGLHVNLHMVQQELAQCMVCKGLGFGSKARSRLPARTAQHLLIERDSLQATLEERLNRSEETRKTFRHFLTEVARGSENTKNGRNIPAKVRSAREHGTGMPRFAGQCTHIRWAAPPATMRVKLQGNALN